jgi:hypothetical protein
VRPARRCPSERVSREHPPVRIDDKKKATSGACGHRRGRSTASWRKRRSWRNSPSLFELGGSVGERLLPFRGRMARPCFRMRWEALSVGLARYHERLCSAFTAFSFFPGPLPLAGSNNSASSSFGWSA